MINITIDEISPRSVGQQYKVNGTCKIYKPHYLPKSIHEVFEKLSFEVKCTGCSTCCPRYPEEYDAFYVNQTDRHPEKFELHHHDEKIAEEIVEVAEEVDGVDVFWNGSMDRTVTLEVHPLSEEIDAIRHPRIAAYE